MQILKYFALVSVFAGSTAFADSFTCRLAAHSTKSTDASFSLPDQVLAVFAADGQSVTLSNSTAQQILNCTLPYERLNGSHLIFTARGVEGLVRQADILALSVEAFFMTVNGEDETPTARSWSGDYGCTRIKSNHL